MEKVFVFDHPLIQHKLSIVRNKDTQPIIFRELISEIGSLMTYESTRDLEVQNVNIETPIGDATCHELKDNIVICPVLRAGLGMAEGIHKMIPQAKVGHIGLYRDEETLEPCEYYAKFPKCIKDALVLIVDPMLATGGSAKDAISMIKKRGAKNIKFNH